jgi:hypothetical protein
MIDEIEFFHLSEDAHPKIKSTGHLVAKVGNKKHNETLKNFTRSTL